MKRCGEPGCSLPAHRRAGDPQWHLPAYQEPVPDRFDQVMVVILATVISLVAVMAIVVGLGLQHV